MHNSNLRRNNKVVLTLTKVSPLFGIKDSSKAFAFETVGKTGVLLSTSWGAGAKKLREVLVPMEGKKICISGAGAARQGLSAYQNNTGQDKMTPVENDANLTGRIAAQGFGQVSGLKSLTDSSFLLNLKPHHWDADVSSSFASFKLTLQTR